jgi:NAD(P)-dependent dehydrogenase (short-subunit alcohol dehydrogenase family)
MYNPFSLIGKTILITGASSGIGRATAIECSKMGARLIITGRNQDRLHETRSLLDGADHILFAYDLTLEGDIKELCALLPNDIDGVAHCAGVSSLKPIIGLNTQNLQDIFSTNYYAPVLLTKYLVKSKKLKQGASLVYVGSISGVSNVATALSAYGSSKSALNSFVQYAALELAGKHVRCNAVLPGRIETQLLQNQTMSEEELQKDIAKYPLHRYGTPTEVAQAIIYLLSDATKWVTGTSITIDGGRSLI